MFKGINLNAGQVAFRKVIRGDMITVKELSSEEIADWEWRWKYGKVAGKHKAWRTTCTVEVYPDRQSKFTAVMYEGEDAECIWEKEFEKFSRTRNPLVAQLFGINRSEIPMLIFHDELIPLAHFFNKESIWMDVYIEHLRINMRCGRKRLWMNTASGVLLSGPDGPSAPSFRTNVVRSIIVPTTVDMLKDDTCIRFFINFGPSVDINIQWCAFLSFKVTFLDDLVPAMADNHQSKDSDYPNWGSATYLYLWHWQNRPNHLPMNIIGGLRFDTVYSPSMEAIARWPQGAGSLWEWREYNRKGLAEETVLDDRLTRFQLDLARGKEVYLGACHSYSWKFGTEWLSQSSWVFDAIGIVEERENFFIVKPPDLKIQSTRRPTASRTLCNDKHSVKETPPTPIYLFLHPFPVSVLELVSWIEGRPYFWSFDETGQSRMSEEECERWGLPMFTVSTCYPNEFLLLYSWSTHVYTTLRDWQKARGFDPTTSDWAQHMGCPQFEIFSKLGRVREDRGEKKASSSWWEAFAGSGISAFGI
ncbi:hypothetical protein Moror_3428 [Moniliophthora roreri MCA 2997]|uniref:Uncharacterized protein n=1 Tax=Moniliophthora roreri (strain MCA 2997) TaxID=1381753 RepID=V2WZ68_MONRO|nr:hypothetical protein Moror_3428 [Moniliophthora roreri MCA 2997]KAI3621273.1 hypothetical protein WG66_014330 [Moniliophthora roreri]